VTRDLLAFAFGNACVLAAGHGVLRAVGLRPALRDLPWSLGVGYIAGAAAVGVLGSLLLTLGLALTWWQIVLLCLALAVAGVVRPRGGRREPRQPARVAARGWIRLLPVAASAALAVLAVDLAVQPIWADDAWAIWTIKAASVVELNGLDPAFLSSASVFNADYPLVVPVLELVALRFCGLPNELVPLQLGLVFLAFPAALVALLRDRVRPLLAWTVGLAVALAPSLQIQAASAVADVTLAVFFALAGAAGWRWIERGENEMLWLAAVLAAAAVGTKVEGAFFVAVLFVGLAIAAPARRRLPVLIRAAVLVAVTALPWEIWSRRHGLGNAFSDTGGIGSVDLLPALDRIPRAALAIGREVADPTGWLALVALSSVAIVLALLRRERLAAARFTLFVTGVCLAGLVAVYWTTPLDFDYHLATSVRRVVTAPVLFAAAMTPLLLSRDQQSR
jgi:hypothetical protein